MDMPRDMKSYLRHNGWHFTKAASDFAASKMTKVNPVTKEELPIEPYTKKQVEDMLQRYGFDMSKVIGYDHVYLANLVKADYLKSSIEDEAHTVKFIKDNLTDGDAADGEIMFGWYAKMIKRDIIVPWGDLL